MSQFHIKHRGRTAPSASGPSEKDQTPIRAHLETVSSEESGCALCGDRAVTVGIFTPTPSFALRIGQPEGKQRLAVYGLCQHCARLPDLTGRIEQELLANWRRGKSSMAARRGLPDS
jgi:hypothetical protein